MILELNLHKPESATILAALRLWQLRGYKVQQALGEGEGDRLYRISTNNGEILSPLLDTEIDELCEVLEAALEVEE